MARLLSPSAASPDVVAHGGHSVTIEGVTRAFGDVAAVDDVSLEIPAGEFLSILGPSGCGKTTLLRILAGFEEPDAGRVLIDGKDVTFDPPHRRPTNLVFQRGALFPHRTVFENVAYPLQRRGESRDRVRSTVAQMLEMVRLAGFESRRPSEISGGQAQRVALARALAAKPAVLLLDEPLSALDLSLRKEMQLELRRLQEELGTTFVFVTHDQEEALTMSSRIVIMRAGRVEQVGTPRDIYENPASTFASTFIGDCNLLRGIVTSAVDGIAVVAVGELSLRVADPRPLAVGTDVALSVRPERITTLGDDPADAGMNVVSGEVLELVFLGNRVRARLACGASTVWVEEPPTTPTARRLTEGSVARIGWSIDAGRLLVAESPST